MKVNIVANYSALGLSQDTHILRGLLELVFEGVEIFKVEHYVPTCQDADINFFLEVVNPTLFIHARKNILIPNPEWYFKNWIPYLNMFDEVWVKTGEAETLFRQTETTTLIRKISWTSLSKTFSKKTEDAYNNAIVLVGKNKFRHPKQLLRAYVTLKQSNPQLYEQLPKLNIPYNPERVTIFCPEEIRDKVNLITTFLTDKEYDELLTKCGLAICLSVAEGYGHAVNEAMSAGCNLLLSPISAFLELTENQKSVFWTDVLEKMEHPACLGHFIDSKSDSIIAGLVQYINRPFSKKIQCSEKMRGLYELKHKNFVETFSPTLLSLKSEEPYCLEKTLPQESDLPDVSLITVTRNRREFMPLAIYCYLIQSYPESKMEWVIVDDGDDPIEDCLMGIPNVKYVRCEKSTIGEKRDIGVQNAMYDTLIMMDDDDIYPNNSVLSRVATMLKSPQKEVAFCTTIPCYDIINRISFMNVPPMVLRQSERVSEATLVFTRKFWEERKFGSQQIAEGDAFIRGREHMCRELSPQEVIVSLVHGKNTSARKVPAGESNGCHYGLKDELFALLESIRTQKTSQPGETSACDDGGGPQLPLQPEVQAADSR